MSFQPSSSQFIFTSLGTGVAGWVLENALFGQRYSVLLPHVPFLPVYAVGGAAISLLEPRIQNMHPAARFLIYAGALTAVEGTAGWLDRANGHLSWTYENGSSIDLKHAIAWGFLGLLTEAVIKNLKRP